MLLLTVALVAGLPSGEKSTPSKKLPSTSASSKAKGAGAAKTEEKTTAAASDSLLSIEGTKCTTNLKKHLVHTECLCVCLGDDCKYMCEEGSNSKEILGGLLPGFKPASLDSSSGSETETVSTTTAASTTSKLKVNAAARRLKTTAKPTADDANSCLSSEIK